MIDWFWYYMGGICLLFSITIVLGILHKLKIIKVSIKIGYGDRIKKVVKR